MNCRHFKFKITPNDREFLRSIRVKVYQCHICEQEAELQKRLPPPKLKIEPPQQGR